MGPIKGTPTIKFVIPNEKKNKKGKFNKKIVRDYNGERELKAMLPFAESSMPSAIERINGVKDLVKVKAKAAKYGLPLALVFLKEDSHVVKHMSIEFRRRLLVVVVKGTKNNKAVMEKFKVKDLPAVLAFPVHEEDSDLPEPTILNKKPTFGRLTMFFGKHALDQPVFGKKKKEEEEPREEL